MERTGFNGPSSFAMLGRGAAEGEQIIPLPRKNSEVNSHPRSERGANEPGVPEEGAGLG